MRPPSTTERGRLPGRLGSLRLAAAAAACLSCLAAAGCGGLTAATLRPFPQSTVDPLARLPAGKVVTEAVADAEAAPSLTMSGTVTDAGSSIGITLGFKRGGGCVGSVSYPDKGTVKLIVVGKAVYLKPDAKFWTANAGAKAPLIMSLLNGRYLEASASDKTMADLASVCSLSTILNSGSAGTYAKEAVTTLDGIRVLPIKLSDGSTEYVTDTPAPEFVKAIAPKGSKVGAGDVSVSVDAPVTLTAPSASQVLNEDQLGRIPTPASTGPVTTAQTSAG